MLIVIVSYCYSNLFFVIAIELRRGMRVDIEGYIIG
jgi:hypothetical protein